MKTIIWIIGILIVAAIAFVLAGYLLPESRRFQKIYTFQTDCKTVWELVRNIEGQTAWRSDVKSIEWIDQSKEIWKETSMSGHSMIFRTAELVPDKKWRMEILEPAQLKGGWTGLFDTKETGCKVTFEESIEMKNPITRIFSFLFFDMNATMNLYLSNLAIGLQEEFHEEKIITHMD